MASQKFYGNHSDVIKEPWQPCWCHLEPW